MNANATNELLQAILSATDQQKTAALRFLRGVNPSTGSIFITGTQGAKLLGISRTTFRRWSKEAQLKRVQILGGTGGLVITPRVTQADAISKADLREALAPIATELKELRADVVTLREDVAVSRFVRERSLPAHP